MRTISDFSAQPGRDYPLGEAVLSDDPCPACDGTTRDGGRVCKACLGSGRIHVYRYVLNRRWNGHGPVMPWICLNPSTADASLDDPSIRRMTWFARREGCGGICVLNLYALRSANPRALSEYLGDPIGPYNDDWLRGLTAETIDFPVVAAWGAHKFAAARAAVVLDLLGSVPLACLGTNKDGSPKHPLYLPNDAPMIGYGGPS